MTNERQAFKQGEIISYCGDTFEVIENFGDTGTVKETGKGGTVVTGFHWNFAGEKSVRLDSCEALRILDGVK